MAVKSLRILAQKGKLSVEQTIVPGELKNNRIFFISLFENFSKTGRRIVHMFWCSFVWWWVLWLQLHEVTLMKSQQKFRAYFLWNPILRHWCIRLRKPRGMKWCSLLKDWNSLLKILWLLVLDGIGNLSMTSVFIRKIGSKSTAIGLNNAAYCPHLTG